MLISYSKNHLRIITTVIIVAALFLTALLGYSTSAKNLARAETPAPKDFYVGLYGSTKAYDYFQNSLFSTVVYQVQYHNWKDRPYIPEFIYNFAHTNSIRNDRQLIIRWLYAPREDVFSWDEFYPWDETWWTRTKELIDYLHQKEVLADVYAITLSEETYNALDQLNTLYDRTKDYLNSLGYENVLVFQWDQGASWCKGNWGKNYLNNLKADGYVLDKYWLAGEDFCCEVGGFLQKGKPVVPMFAYSVHTPEKECHVYHNEDQVNCVLQLAENYQNLNHLTFYTIDQCMEPDRWAWNTQTSDTVKNFFTEIVELAKERMKPYLFVVEVRDGATLNPIDGATVTLDSVSKQSNQDGKAQFYLSSFNTHQLEVRAARFQPQNYQIQALSAMYDSKEASVDSILTRGLIVNLTALIPGDADGDGVVDEKDLELLKEDYLSQPAHNTDFNSDGRVDSEDFAILQSNYLK